MSKNTDTAIAILAGVALGAAAGILFAPEKGEKTRKRLKDGYYEKKDELSDKFDALSDKMKSRFSKKKADLESTFDDLIANVDDKSSDIIATLERKLDALKKAAATVK